jgi:Tfp pilus assembly protein PilV
MVTARAGFSLVETVVAAVLLSVAVLSVAAGGAAALRAIAGAERQHGALTAGAAVLDSLAQRPAAVPPHDSILALSVLAAPAPFIF